MESKFFECACYSSEHTLKFMYDGEDLWTEIYLHQYKSFFKRICCAIKYVFGYKCKWGDFDCFVFKTEDLPKFRDMISEICEEEE